ncbi:Crp/Fnr family transcriptional regulator [Rhodoferax ferrireducens]|uniref:Crp/Fnr family transcriptional regulator n=1 Tax=Rhodoferax ferrireducens TaxID=192843 RepID=UPI000E0D92B3|nr:Crp/Fnr family transcriptional regulator [Rhodoferax ferrireducens]
MTATDTPPLPPALQDLLPADLRPACTYLKSKRGDRLFTLRKKPQRMFYVASGEVVLQRVGVQGDSLVLQRVRQGFVAEASLQSAHYHCDAVVTSPADLIAIPIEPLRQALVTDPAFAMRWIAMLNQELKRLRLQCERLSLRGVADRLLHLIETEGERGRLPLRAGLKSVAAELGVSHEALYRTVAELEKQQVLQRAEGELRIL